MEVTATHLWAASVLFTVLTFAGGYLDKRQRERRRLDRPGCISWPLVQIFALIGAVVSAVLALKLA